MLKNQRSRASSSRGTIDDRNRLGDARAEHDPLLDSAFVQTHEYRLLLDNPAGYVVVGRRGTGKSALFRALRKTVPLRPRTRVIDIVPHSSEVRPIHSILRQFSNTTYDALQDFSTALWRYILIMNVATDIAGHRPALMDHLAGEQRALLLRHISRWRAEEGDSLQKMFGLATKAIGAATDVGLALGTLNPWMQMRPIGEMIDGMLVAADLTYVVLADALDEGFEPGSIAVAFVNGLVSAGTDLTLKVPRIRLSSFLRDNIFRSIQRNDANFTRNIEGKVLRLHWDEGSLLQLVARRLRAAFGDRQSNRESSPEDGELKVWNQHTSGSISGVGGFRNLLKLTLYRPRDVVTILNASFYRASARESARMSDADVEQSADEISRNRLNDLVKEYDHVVPGLEKMISKIGASGVRFIARDARRLVRDFIDASVEPEVMVHAKASGVETILEDLHSIGFFGFRRTQDGPFIFSHDGRLADLRFSDDTQLMIHPCYWRSLESTPPETRVGFDPEDIFDEYSDRVAIDVTSVVRERRLKEIDAHIATLDTIDIGPQADDRFAEWLCRGLGILLSAGVRDLERNGNVLHGGITSVRDFWLKLQTDYGARTIVVVSVNSDTPTVHDVQTVLKRAKSLHLGAAFVCGRTPDAGVRRGPVLDAIRTAHADQQVLVGYFNAVQVVKALGRLRAPGKAAESGEFLRRVVEQTEQAYLPSAPHAGRKRRGKPPKERRRELSCPVVLVVVNEIERDTLIDAARDDFGFAVEVVHGRNRSYFVLSGDGTAVAAVVQSEMGAVGIGGSASTSREAIAELRPRVVVAVGVAFGMRPDKAQIGDVLVSKQLKSYEQERVNAAGSGSPTYSRGDKVHATARVLNRLRTVEASWKAAPVRFGLLLSGERLIDNEGERDALRDLEPEAIGGEMEGHGVYTSAQETKTDWVIVKAICDWADGRKGEDKESRQRVAAGNAAAFVLTAIQGGALP